MVLLFCLVLFWGASHCILVPRPEMERAPALEVWGHAVEWVFFNSLCWAFCLIKPEDSGLLILGKLTILLLSFSVFSFWNFCLLYVGLFLMQPILFFF